MKTSDKKVFESLRNMYAVLTLPHSLPGVLVQGIGSLNKDWAGISDDVATRLLEDLFDHPAHESVEADEVAMDLHVAEWAKEVLDLASNYASDNQDVRTEEAIYFVFCHWLGRVVSLFVKWAQEQLETGSFDSLMLAQAAQLRDMLLREVPSNIQRWHNTERQIEETAEIWAKKSLLI